MSPRILVKRILSRNNFDVHTANDGAETIEKIQHRDYDIIVLDLMMPRIDGSGVVKFMAKDKPEKLRGVIVMTALGASALASVCPPVGRFLEKPFDLQDLIAEATECYWFSGGGTE